MGNSGSSGGVTTILGLEAEKADEVTESTLMEELYCKLDLLLANHRRDLHLLVESVIKQKKDDALLLARAEGAIGFGIYAFKMYSRYLNTKLYLEATVPFEKELFSERAMVWSTDRHSVLCASHFGFWLRGQVDCRFGACVGVLLICIVMPVYRARYQNTIRKLTDCK